MCGLACLWGHADAAIIATMVERQHHRGPDDRGQIMLADGQGSLGHCRLAIIDPEGGRQPFEGPDDTALVANGMIYNDRELRAAMTAAPFRTGSDSEAILHLINGHGAGAVDGLDGMFAFVYYQDGQITAARDPIGIKPLYTGKVGGSLAFASEIKALAGIATEIEEFPAGHRFTTASGFERYYEVPYPEASRGDLPGTVEELQKTLEAAVVKRLRSDVPFGCFLSGGLDSSIIAALASRYIDGLETFAVGLEGSSDLLAARVVARHLGTKHHELVIEEQDIIEALPRILFHLETYDQDLVRSSVPTYFVAKFAAERVKVVLTGEGADELFAGYTYYRDYDDGEALAQELRRSICAMHNINLQRVDRMTMAHSLEARVPFLDTSMIALGAKIPVAWKLKEENGARVEKWILRKAFEDLLPPEIVWRDKLQFDQGSGFGDLLTATVTGLGRDIGANGARSPEERYYKKLLAEAYADTPEVLDLVAHWEDGDARV